MTILSIFDMRTETMTALWIRDTCVTSVCMKEMSIAFELEHLPYLSNFRHKYWRMLRLTGYQIGHSFWSTFCWDISQRISLWSLFWPIRHTSLVAYFVSCPINSKIVHAPLILLPNRNRIICKSRLRSPRQQLLYFLRTRCVSDIASQESRAVAIGNSVMPQLFFPV